MYCDIPDLGRCCMCLPLRKGVLVFGYLNILFSLVVIGVYSAVVHKDYQGMTLVYHGAVSLYAPVEVCIFLYCVEVIFHALLLYGAHTKQLQYVRVFYYFAVTTVVATVLIQVIGTATSPYWYAEIEMLVLTFAGLCIQVYLIILVRSLLKKLEISDHHTYENQLHQIVSGERKIEGNGVYNPSTEPCDV